MAVVGIFLLLLGAFLELARTLALPVVSAAVVAMMLGPLQSSAARRRIPASLFALVALVAMIVILNIAMILLSGLIAEWLGKAGDIAASIKSKLQFLDGTLLMLSDMQSAISQGGPNADLKIEMTSLIQPVLGFLSPAIGETVVFGATLFFLLSGRVELRRHLVLLFADKETRIAALRALNETEQSLTRYVATVSVINVVVGTITALIAYLLGLPSPLTWGALAGVLNYLPYIGPTIMALILFIVGLVALPTLGHAVLAPALFVAMATAEGHFVTPSIIGKRLGLTPLLVFLALAFWTWLWGAVGAFLATPLLIIAIVVRNQVFPGDDVDLPP
jgi:predicted PurR-regulated permease PerM